MNVNDAVELLKQLDKNNNILCFTRYNQVVFSNTVKDINDYLEEHKCILHWKCTLQTLLDFDDDSLSVFDCKINKLTFKDHNICEYNEASLKKYYYKLEKFINVDMLKLYEKVKNETLINEIEAL